MRRKLKLATVLLCLVYLMVTNKIPTNLPESGSDGYARESNFTKAVWVSTIYGMDYPKEATTNSIALKSGINEIIKNVKDMGFNTIFFQVRPACDALYKSDIFPWSKYLTGDFEKIPANDFDPLDYLTKEAHKNNISVHAWINPYRITASANEKDALPVNSPATLYSDWVIDYNGKLYFNPGIPEVNDFIAKGAKEIAEKYDIDGIQIDDYFYPGEDFPDDWSYSVYGKDYKDKGDWRRENINSLIEKISDAVKKANPGVLFGVSPQGIWANSDNLKDGSNTSGKESYFTAYADTRKWVKENKIDYIIPQIYWNIGYAGADFGVLLNWWNDVVEGTKVKLIIGQAAYKVSENSDSASVWYGKSGAEEINKQILLCQKAKNVSGYSMFRYSSLLNNPILKSVVTECNTGKEQVFWDIAAIDWAKDDIIYLYEKGIANGMADGIFAPYDKVTRGQFAVMISRILNKQASFSENFEDVSPDKYYYEHIGILKELGLINGRSETEFDPDSNISRQDMAALVYRILIKEKIIEEKTYDNLSFTDKDEIKDYAKNAVSALIDKELLKGYEDNSFRPSDNATRAECSVFLSRIYKLLYK